MQDYFKELNKRMIETIREKAKVKGIDTDISPLSAPGWAKLVNKAIRLNLPDNENDDYYIDDNKMYKYLNDKLNLPLHLIVGFCQVLDISLDDFICDVYSKSGLRWRKTSNIDSLDLNTSVPYYPLDIQVDKERDRSILIDEIWIALLNFDIELNPHTMYYRLAPSNMERGVKYTYFVPVSIEKSNVESFRRLCSNNENLKIEFITDDYRPASVYGTTVYEPNKSPQNGRIAYEDHLFYGMKKTSSFRLHDDVVEELVQKLRKYITE